MSISVVVGFVMMILLVFILLKGLFPPNVVFVLLPTVAGLLCGFSVKDLGGFVGKGLQSVLNTATLLVFAILFFSIMKEIGVFNVIVKFIIKYLKNSVLSVLIVSIIISAVCSLDGNAYATLLVTVPALMPIFDKMKISRKSLFLCIAIGVGATGVTPWGGSLLRAVAVTNTDPIALYRSLIPIQGVIVVLGVITAILVSKVEKSRGAGMSDEEFQTFKVKHVEETLNKKTNNKLLPVNFILLIVTMGLLISGIVSSYYLFMISTAIAMVLNFPDSKECKQKIKDYSGTVMPVMITFLSIGAFLGIVQGTNIFNSLVEFLVSLFPASFGPHIYILIAVFSVPIVIALGSDAFYFALLPIVAGIADHFGVSGYSVTIALLVTEQIGLLLSPAIPATYVGLGLLNLEIGEHVKYSFVWVWAISIIALVSTVLLGIIPI